MMQIACEKIMLESVRVKSLRFRMLASVDEALIPVPGQYATLSYSNCEGIVRQRCYSIIRVQPPNIFEVAIQRSGNQRVSDNLYDKVEVGDLLTMVGIGGRVTVDCIRGRQRVLMLAAGIGLTLPLALLRELGNARRQGEAVPDVVLLVSTPTLAELPFMGELQSLSHGDTWLSVHIHVTREQAGGEFKHGRIDDGALARVQAVDSVVICGGLVFAQQMQRLASRHFPQAQQLIEAFSSPEPVVACDDSGSMPGRLLIPGDSRSFPLRANSSLLEMLLESGLDVAHECHSGICGSCRVRLVQGECRREPDFALSTREREQGYVLACCTYPTGHSLTVDISNNDPTQ